jgi:ATP-dependent Clp protease ATP-binding subunit ClpA
MFDLNQAISEWRKKMIAGGINPPAVLDELENHRTTADNPRILCALGLLESENSCVPKVLRKMGVSCETVREEIEKIVGNGPKSQTNRPPPYTPRAMRALKLAILEAKASCCDRVGAEHMFLGLVIEGSGVAAQVLNRLGVNTEKARKEVLKEISKPRAFSKKL